MGVLSKYLPTDVLKGIDVTEGMPYGFRDMAGVTFGSKVYVKHDRQDTAGFIGLLAHEVSHTVQQSVHGAVFWASYITQAAVGMISLKGQDATHDGISWEQRADQLQNKVLADLKAGGNDPCGCGK
jgi:hypothetical protein